MEIPGKLLFEDVTIGSQGAVKLLEEIRTGRYTGYLEIEFDVFQFLLFFVEGVPTHGFRVIEEQLFSFSSLADMLPSLQGGHVKFFKTTVGALQALLDMKFGEQVYGNLYTSFTDLGKLLVALQQKKYTGSVEIDLPSLHCFIIMEESIPREIVCSKENPTLECIVNRAASENGVIRVFERRSPPTILSPDPEEVFAWSRPNRLKLEFAFGQLGKEFEKLLDQKMTISQILNTLCVDFAEIVGMYTYLSAKGYIVTMRKENS